MKTNVKSTKKPVKKSVKKLVNSTRPRLNKAGIEKLKADLRANAELYNQWEFAAEIPDCGTEVCMAGMCFYKLVGETLFLNMLGYSTSLFNDICLKTAYMQLGIVPLTEKEYIVMSGQSIPPIFNRSKFWPDDLKTEYDRAFAAHNHVGMVEAACKALDRIDVHGCFKKRRR